MFCNKKLPTEIETSKEKSCCQLYCFWVLFCFFCNLEVYICYWYQVRTLSTTVWMCFLVLLYHIWKVRSSKRTKGNRNMKRNRLNPSFVLSAEPLKTSQSLFPTCQHYHIDLVLWLMSLELLFPNFSHHTLTDQQKIWILTTSFRHHVTGGEHLISIQSSADG